MIYKEGCWILTKTFKTSKSKKKNIECYKLCEWFFEGQSDRVIEKGRNVL